MAARLMSLLSDRSATAAAVLAAAGGLGLLAWRVRRSKPTAAAEQPALPRLAPVDGLRALSTLSLVALHTAMIATSFLKPGTPDWQRVTQHPLFGLFLGGSLQTDIFLLLGGLLAGLRLRSQAQRGGAAKGSLTSDVTRRALRLWPVTLLQLGLGYVVLGEPRGKAPWIATIVATVLTFVNNYGSTAIHTSLACTPGWSVCVDFQCGLALSAAWRALRRRLPSPDAAARWLLGAAFAASLAIRAAVFFGNPTAMSVIRMPMHFGQVQSGASAAWFQTQFPPFKWLIEFGSGFGTAGLPASDTTAAAWKYLGALYFPTHARFGPYVLGALIAWCLPAPGTAPHGADSAPPSRGVLRSLPLVFFTMQSLATLGAAMMPPPLDVEALPPAVHALATIAGPSLGAAAAGFLLYTALVPESSRWHNPWLRSFLGWRPFRWLADKSFAVNMLHFRLILGLIFTAGTISGKQLAPEEVTWTYIGALYVGGLAASLAAASAAVTVEPALRAAIERTLFGKGDSATKKQR